MKVVNSPQVQTQIQRYKRFLERTELYNYPAFINGHYYYNVAYWRWGKKDAAGFLILRPDGEVVPRNEAEPVVKLFLVHAHVGRKIKNNLAIDKEKPIEMYEQKWEYLKSLLPFYQEKMDAVIRKDVEKLIDVCETMVESRVQLRAVYDKAMELLNQFFARNYVIEGEEAVLLDLLYESDYILYERIRKQALIRDSVDRIYLFFRTDRVDLDREQEKKRKKLSDLLNTYKSKGLQNIADKSIQSFETHTIGAPESFHSAEQLREAHDKLNQRFVEKGMMTTLRNP